jgi:hypothetical protein
LLVFLLILDNDIVKQVCQYRQALDKRHFPTYISLELVFRPAPAGNFSTIIYSDVQGTVMRVEEISEAIEVIALFHRGKLSPIKFRWRERVYKILCVNGHWTSEEGATRFHHFAVTSADADVFEIRYNDRRHDWTLEKVSLL